MPRRLGRALLFLVLVVTAGPARAQDDILQLTYAAVEQRTRAEYEFTIRGIARELLRSGAPYSKSVPIRERMKMLSYNRAALFAFCAAEADAARAPGAARVPFQNNLLMTTCVEIKVGQLQKFSQLASYADFFFPARIEPCGEQSRLPEREKILAPYAFLQLDEPKLYDFARYNECLMTH
jgi:hypothetical protein